MPTKGHVIHKPSGNKAHYGELVEAASQLEPPENPELKEIRNFKVIGTTPKRKDIPPKTNGSAIYGLDLRIDNMLYASVERSPVFHGKVKSYNRAGSLADSGCEVCCKNGDAGPDEDS